MLTGLLDVPYRKSFALLEELLERREAEEQTLAIWFCCKVSDKLILR
ncbi:hypothetical protein I4L82_000492 [Enterococcus faecalis]|nr:hypothetical protein [Enterococcus faecalis]